MWKRFFCAGAGGGDADGEWVVARSTFLQTQSLYSKARVLDVLQDELEERYISVAGRRVVLESGSMKRLHRANLPAEDSQRATELLGKLTAIDRTRQEAEKERTQIQGELARAQAGQREAEFGMAKAEALATARGQALMHAQQAGREAEQQQVQLSEMLQMALAQLGMALTPNKSVAASEHGGFAAALAEQQKEGSGARSVPLNLAEADAQQWSAGSGASGAASSGGTPLSGFTVYSNELHSSPAGGEGAAVPINPGISATSWRDISAAAAPSPCRTVTPPATWGAPLHAPAPAMGPEEQAHRLARLIVPQLDASQLESLVRIGASMASPGGEAPPSMPAEARRRDGAQPANSGRQGRRAAPPLPPRDAPAAEIASEGGDTRPEQGQGGGGFAPVLSPQNHARAVRAVFKTTEFYQPFAAGMAPLRSGTESAPASARGEPSAAAGGGAARAPERAFQPSAPWPAHSQQPAPRAGSEGNARGPRPNEQAPALRRSTFSLGLPPSQRRLQQQQREEEQELHGSSETVLIKAVPPRGARAEERGAMHAGHLAAEEHSRRQQRAAERLVQRLNEKLPPQLRQSSLLAEGNPGGKQVPAAGPLGRAEA